MKVQNPIIGRARGSAGGMTFCKNYDKNVARAKAFEVSNPNTQAQQTQRNFFKQLTALCSDFSEDQLRTLFPSKPKTMSRRNALSKQIAESYAIDGTEKNIDFANIDTLGNAPVLDFGVVEFESLGISYIVSFNDLATNYPSLSDNDVAVVLFNVTKKAVSFSQETATVSTVEYELAIPSGWSPNDKLSGVLLVLNSKNGEFATKGFGKVQVLKRPARKND